MHILFFLLIVRHSSLWELHRSCQQKATRDGYGEVKSQLPDISNRSFS